MPVDTQTADSYREDLVNSGVVIKTEELAKVYEMGAEQVHALRGVNLEIRKGEYEPPGGIGWQGALLAIWTTMSSPTFGTKRSGSYFRPLTCCRAQPLFTTSSCLSFTTVLLPKSGSKKRKRLSNVWT